jgi:hypothetical protein
MTVTLLKSRSKLSLHVSNLLEDFAAWIVNHQGLCMVFIALLYVPMALVEAHAHPLRHDELFTWGISRAPSVRLMIERIHAVDLNPPLSYVLERLSLMLPGPRWLLARLPSMLAGLLASEMIFLVFARRLSNLFGIFALSIFWVSAYVEYSWQNRPYMLWMAALSVLLFAWQERAGFPRRKGMLALMLAAATMAAASHFLAVLSLLPFLGAAFFTGRRRSMDWTGWMAVAVPTTIAFAIDLNASSQATSIRRVLYPPDFLPRVDTVGWMYVEMFLYFGIAVFACVIVRAFLPVRHGPQEAYTRALQPEAREIALFAGLSLQGLLVAFIFTYRQVAFFPRYGIASVLGVAGLLTWFFYRRVARAAEIATLLAFALILASVARTAVDLFVFDVNGNPGSDMIAPRPPLATSTGNLPIVAASGLTFVEMNDREAAPTRARTFYLTDREAATRFAHATLFENEKDVQEALGLHGTVVPYHDFLATHPHFFVVGTYTYPEDWLLRKLYVDGAVLIYRGKVRSTYKDDDLYEVKADAAR